MGIIQGKSIVLNEKEKIPFEAKTFSKQMTEDKELRDKLYNKLCESMIMKYKKHGEDLDDVDITDESIEE